MAKKNKMKRSAGFRARLDDERKAKPAAPKDAQEPDIPARKSTPTAEGDGEPAKSGQAGGAVHPDNVLKQMKIEPQFQQSFIGAVKSVMHFITNPTTHKLFLNSLQGPGPVAQKLAEGVEHLLMIIMHQVGPQAFAPKMYIPVGMYAISWVADYVRRARLLPVQDSDVAEAMQMFIHSTVTSLKAAQQQGGLLGAAQKPPGGAPAQPGAPPPALPQPGPAMPKLKPAPMQAPGSNPNLGPGPAPGPQAQAVGAASVG